MKFEKTPSWKDILEQLRSGRVELPPFQIEVEKIEAISEKRQFIDAIVLLYWGSKRYRFAAECGHLSTPKALSQLSAHAKQYSSPPALYPLVVVPYLAASRLEALRDQGVNGIDLCGNGVVSVPEEVLVFRTGQPNRFRSDAEIKNAFRGTSSLVPRVFLVRGEYDSVQAARAEILKRAGNLVLGTVSKVCKGLEDLLLIERSREEGSAARQLRLIQADKLLDLLASNCVPPSNERTFRGKTNLSPEALRKALSMAKAKVVQTGFGSVGNYAVLAREAMQYFYTTDFAATRQALGKEFEETDRFANVTFIETKDDTVYFDPRPGLVASPVQTYLELATGDKRSQETAEQLRRVILGPLEVRKE